MFTNDSGKITRSSYFETFPGKVGFNAAVFSPGIENLMTGEPSHQALQIRMPATNNFPATAIEIQTAIVGAREKTGTGDAVNTVIATPDKTTTIILQETMDGLTPMESERWDSTEGTISNAIAEYLSHKGLYVPDLLFKRPEVGLNFMTSKFFMPQNPTLCDWVKELWRLPLAFTTKDHLVEGRSSELAIEMRQALQNFASIRSAEHKDMLAFVEDRIGTKLYKTWFDGIFSRVLLFSKPGFTAIALHRSRADTITKVSVENTEALIDTPRLFDEDANAPIENVAHAIIELLGPEKGRLFYQKYIYPAKLPVYGSLGSSYGTANAMMQFRHLTGSRVDVVTLTDGCYFPERSLDRTPSAEAVNQTIRHFQEGARDFFNHVSGRDDATLAQIAIREL